MAVGRGEIVPGLAALSFGALAVAGRFMLSRRVLLKYRLRASARRIRKSIDRTSIATEGGVGEISKIQTELGLISSELRQRPSEVELLDIEDELKQFAAFIVARPFATHESSGLGNSAQQMVAEFAVRTKAARRAKRVSS